ncbi:GumC family protein [Maritimibacter dapengensis]|uniref:non-specific protein-tyrosine kinase n=1 Tax=Maritimibacter dapengensis TaxID=2836868 RepID=A0ABS6SYB0_9RHOB|nr:polysaccharide biosynthesis tyrosine autokinase [Maritimibacter dapengensis]MBV7377959.1 polysaccharide biosynthesis tyrosine autokinase [Maritimibacter dapengensis]
MADDTMSGRQQPGRDEVDLSQAIGAIWSDRILILAFIAFAGLVGGVYAFHFSVAKYSATARIVLDVRSNDVIDLESAISGVSTDVAAINTEIEMIRSRELTEQLVDRLGLVEDPEFNVYLSERPGFSPVDWLQGVLRRGGEKPLPPLDIQRARTIAGVQGALTATAPKDTYIFNISFTTTDRRKSQIMANTLAEIYVQNQIDIKIAATETAVDWLSNRVTELDAQIEAKTDRIEEIRADGGLITRDTVDALVRQTTTMAERFEGFDEQLERIQSRLQQVDIAEKMGDPVAAADLLDDGGLIAIASRENISDQSRERQTRHRLATLRDAETARMAQIMRQRSAVEQSLADLRLSLARQNARFDELSRLVRDVEATTNLYGLFLSRLKELSLQIGIQQSDARVMSRASTSRKTEPQEARTIAFSVILGLMGGVGVVLLREFGLSVFRTGAELEAAFDHPSLGSVPKLPRKSPAQVIDHFVQDSVSPASESVRNLRTSLMMSSIDKPPQVIMSTSALPGEGKTIHSVALAISFARVGRRVLLIEADLRRRAIQEYFGLSPEVGFGALVAGDVSRTDVIVHDETLGVDLLLSGNSTANAADLFSSRRFRHLLSDLRKDYDIILLDAPPVLLVPDARIIGQQSDAILFSVRAGTTRRPQVAAGLRELTTVGLEPTGFVLSQVESAKRRYGRYEGYGNHAFAGKGYYGDARSRT